MSDKSGIEWTEATWNPTTGCTKVSPGCKFCYAKHQAWPRLSKNPKGVYTGRKFEDVQWHSERLDQPIRWTKPRMIFVNSMSDLFHDDIPDWFIDRVFAVMAACPKHTFQVLTKRAERMHDYCNTPNLYERIHQAVWAHYWWREIPSAMPFSNVWLGVSVENQETANDRIPWLVDTPAAVKWLSCEPLLGPVNLFHRNMLNWVVVGGESGKNARPMWSQWAMSLRSQCAEWDVPFFMKQGSQNNWIDYKNIESFPGALRVREYPK